MSQNNDQGRRNPSQPWYDNGEVPQSKKFPFGPGDGAPQDQGGDARPNTPAYGQPSVDDAPQAPNYGGDQGQYRQEQPRRDEQQYQPPQHQQDGGQGHGRHADHPTGEQAPGGRYDEGRYEGQDDQQGRHAQYQQDGYQQQGGYQQSGYQQDGGYPQQAGQQGHDPREQQYAQQPSSGGETNQQQYPVPGGQSMTDSGRQPFQGILDPHTGEIHPVPDLDGLQDTDALLVVVSGPDSGSQILLDTDVVTVGRSPNADIFLDDVTVSRKHAEFIRTPSGFTLRDTGSLNGTYVGRQLIDSIELQNGADVQIGKFRMIFQQRPRS